MAAKYGVQRVFVATDSPTVIGEMQMAVPHLHLIHIQNFDRHSLEHSIEHCKRLHPHKTDDGTTLPDGCTGNDAWLEHRLGHGRISRKDLALATILDLILMSEADFFVGHLASNLSRLAYILSVIHHKRMVPFWSVDGPWCYHWRMCCAVRADGSSSVC